MMDAELVGGVAGGGILAAICYRLIGVVETAVAKRNGGGATNVKVLEKIVKTLSGLETNQETTARALSQCLDQVREIKGITYEIRTAQRLTDAVETDRLRRT